MQLDNEIGKVALATPILICNFTFLYYIPYPYSYSFMLCYVMLCVAKALEVFMQNLVDETCKRVQSNGSTKIESLYL